MRTRAASSEVIDAAGPPAPVVVANEEPSDVAAVALGGASSASWYPGGRSIALK